MSRAIIARGFGGVVCSILIILLIGLCKTPSDPGDSGTSVGSDPMEACGECLDLPTGDVCTSQGTVRNSCLAICKGYRIECNGSCPCPEKESKKN